MLLYKVASFVVIDFENGVDYISFSVFDFSALKNGTEYSFVNDQFQVNDYTDVTFIFDKNGNPYTEATLDYFIETIKVIADPNIGNLPAGGTAGQILSKIDSTDYNAQWIDNLSLTTVGNSGPATLIGSVLNIPEYAQDLSGYVPYVGAVSDLNLGVHRILAQRGYFENNGSNDTLNVIHSSGSGYGINVSKGGSGEALRVNKTSGSGNAASILGGVTLIDELRLNTDLSDSYIASASNWNSAFNDKINSASVTGTTTKTLTLNQQDGGTITASWTDINTDAVSSVFGRVGAVVAVNGDYNTSQVTESSNLYYTEARVNANANVAANTLARHDAVTIGTANGLSLSGQQLSLGLASASSNGALSATDWNTFNNKQNALTNPITGIGTLNYIPKFTASGSIGDSQIYDNGFQIGIGTTLPNAKLGVAGTIKNEQYHYITNTYDGCGIYADDGGGSTIFSLTRQPSNEVRLQGYSSLTFFTDGSTGTEKMRITYDGKIGMGVSNPASKLHLSGSTTLLTITDTTYNRTSQIGYLDQANLYFANDSNSNTYIGRYNNLFLAYGGGNVGIGTETPLQKLHVGGNILLPVSNSLFFVPASTNYGIGTPNSDGVQIFTAMGDHIRFGHMSSGASFTERMRVAYSGNVGVGTTSPSQKLMVDGNIFASTGNGMGFLLEGGNSILRQSGTELGFNTNGSEKLRITTSGSVGIGTTAPDPSALLHLESTTQGFLPPRMDNSEINAISNPAEGLIVYSTQSKCLFLFDGANWQKIAYA